ncbi:MAG: DUF2851 family protein [Cyclobacteriaceae bacterium]
MDEYFLQFLWKFQKFDSPSLTLTNGQQLLVLKPGYQNHHSGPDFHEAKVKIDELIWSGSVEIHYKASDWYRHQHQKDPAYENVVLHVVWIADQDILIDNQKVPTLEMKRIVSTQLEQDYRNYINQPEVIRCGNHLHSVDSIQIRALLDSALTSRLEHKSKEILDLLAQRGGDWEAVTYHIIAKNFGFKTNAHPFEKLAESLPYAVVRKYHADSTKMDALIFGMAGFLESPVDNYQTQLRKEFDFMVKKHGLDQALSRHHWKHGKLRPANFPSVRLAQFSAFLAHNKAIFNSLILLHDKKAIQSFLKKPVSDYWGSHFDFGKTIDKPNTLGTSSIDLIMINSAVPILAAYGLHLDNLDFIDKAQSILDEIRAESNHITQKWYGLGVKIENASDSQALIHQYNNMCLKKKCLECNIGMSILNRQ